MPVQAGPPLPGVRREPEPLRPNPEPRQVRGLVLALAQVRAGPNMEQQRQVSVPRVPVRAPLQVQVRARHTVSVPEPGLVLHTGLPQGQVQVQVALLEPRQVPVLESEPVRASSQEQEPP